MALTPQSHFLVLSSPQKNIADRYNKYTLTCFELIKNIIKDKHKGKVLIQIVVANNKEQTLFAGLSGLLKTATLENPRIVGQIILTTSQINTDELAAQLHDNQNRLQDTIIKYERGKRHILRWQGVQPTQDRPNIAFKDQGVYLVTGGLGG